LCQNGTLCSTLNRSSSPPFPLRIPTMPPPCPLPTPEVTLSVPFWHSSGCPGPWKAGWDCEPIGRSCAKPIRLTGKGGKDGTSQTVQSPDATPRPLPEDSWSFMPPAIAWHAWLKSGPFPPGGASILHRASQYQPGSLSTGGRQLSWAWPALGRGLATVGTPPCQEGAVSASLRQPWAVCRRVAFCVRSGSAGGSLRSNSWPRLSLLLRCDLSRDWLRAFVSCLTT
jgi:hypothetical protein